MRYLKVLVFVLIFFVSMIFFFQNQATLATEMKLSLNLFFMAPMESISLPFYFLVLAAFLSGAILAMLVLIWDKMNLSAKAMKATWRVRALEKEVAALRASQAQPIALAPKNAKKEEEKKVAEEKKPAEEKMVDVEAKAVPEDIKVPDPDKSA